MMAEFAGTLRERITLERPVDQRSAAGLREGGWAVFADCLASVTLIGAGAEAEGMTLSAMAQYRVTLRVREGVAVGQRVRWKGGILMIRQVLLEPRWPDRIMLKCEEVRS